MSEPLVMSQRELDGEPECSPAWHPETVLQPRYRWVVAPRTSPDPQLVQVAERLGLTPRLLGILSARGLTDPEELAQFFGPAEEAIHDPRRLPDADAFVRRIEQARSAQEKVLVFGDFDADGVTGLAILVLAFRRYGLDVETYIPSRLEEGHGLSLPAVETAARLGCSLIVTVDCATTSNAEVAAANARGIDVIITDHHRVPSVLPEAVAIVNPHRTDATYPDRRLTGSGVAFKLACLLLTGEPGGPDASRGLADLAIIGTVADVAPVLGENRAIARLGLEVLRAEPRPGIAALLEAAGVAPETADLETIGFVIGPRLNAAGRMGEAIDAARLLLASDPDEARALARGLEASNVARRDATKEVLAEARLAMQAQLPGAAGSVPDRAAIVIRGPWPVGIIGLVAARLAEESDRPTIVGAELGDVVRASCRSDGNLDLSAALAECADLLVRFGGHSGAAGFEISLERWDEFRERFEAIAAATAAAWRLAHHDPVGEPAPSGESIRRLAIDVVLDAHDVDYALLRDLARLAPFGPGHREPLIAIRGLTVVRAREAAGGHSQVTLRRNPDVLDAIAFGWPELASGLSEGDGIDIVARVVSRRFGGFESLQLEIRDAAASGYAPAAVEAERTKPALEPAIAAAVT
jgi:single-stranded-DNA-specific exonuclease